MFGGRGLEAEESKFPQKKQNMPDVKSVPEMAFNYTTKGTTWPLRTTTPISNRDRHVRVHHITDYTHLFTITDHSI